MRLETSAQSVIDATGGAAVSTPSPRVGTSWLVEQIIVRLEASGLASLCTTYKNTAVPSNMISPTRTGNSDTDSIPNVTLYPGETVIAVWTGGTVGVIATVSLRGQVVLDGF